MKPKRLKLWYTHTQIEILFLGTEDILWVTWIQSPVFLTVPSWPSEVEDETHSRQQERTEWESREGVTDNTSEVGGRRLNVFGEWQLVLTIPTTSSLPLIEKIYSDLFLFVMYRVFFIFRHRPDRRPFRQRDTSSKYSLTLFLSPFRLWDKTDTYLFVRPIPPSPQ